MNEIIYYKHDHKCEQNGAGDYIFVCPVLGEIGGFVPYMYRSLKKGTCGCGCRIELDVQPIVANAKGIISPCPKCDSPEVNVQMIEKIRKHVGGGREIIYSRVVECLSCGNKTQPILGIPPFIMSVDEHSDLELAWRETAEKQAD